METQKKSAQYLDRRRLSSTVVPPHRHPDRHSPVNTRNKYPILPVGRDGEIPGDPRQRTRRLRTNSGQTQVEDARFCGAWLCAATEEAAAALTAGAD